MFENQLLLDESAKISSVPFNQANKTTPLSREEAMEAKRLMQEATFSFDGYQVVRREFISHRFDPAMTIKGSSIIFNNSCISKLESATYIQFLINPSEQKLVIRPCSDGARDAVRWCNIKDDKRKSRQITCKDFAEKLYNLMGWNMMYRYRIQGMKIHYKGEALYLFDLSSTECFIPQVKDENGKRKASKPITPQEWNNTFGMSVDEHKASTHVDFLESYITEDPKQEANNEFT